MVRVVWIGLGFKALVLEEWETTPGVWVKMNPPEDRRF